MTSVEICLMLDFYGNLLTEKMRKTMEMHYFDDFSLSEIAESENISRQGVQDTLKRAEKILIDYENKLGLMEYTRRKNAAIDKAIELINNNNKEEAVKLLMDLKEDSEN